MRILAIDPGERRLGLAISDPTGTIAQPLGVIVREGWAKDIGQLREIIENHSVEEVVVGRPLTLRGEAGAQARAAGTLAQRLREALEVPVIEVDERFSTAAAERAMREEGRSARARRRRRDAVAAALILQPYLDRAQKARPLRGPDEGVMLAP